MKKLLILSYLCLSIYGYGQESELEWYTDFEVAKQEAKSQDKPILMYFTGSDWCGPCKKLKADFFSSKKFLKESNVVVLLMIDLPRSRGIITAEQQRKNMLLMQRYNRRGSFPTLVGLSHEGKVITEISGYNRNRDTEKHFKFLANIISKN
jgi:thioredoxin-related protein